jgi:hypothetical protein
VGSSAGASVTVSVSDGCPTGYVKVPANPAVGTFTDFCIAKYEMKNVTGVATSQPLLSPWLGLSNTATQASCAALGASYALISNEEWMTVARNAESVSVNWSSGTPGVGVLARGHSDSSPGTTQPASANDNLGYTGTGNNSSQAANAGWEQRRTLTLTNGAVVWDLAGNSSEHIKWTITADKKAFRLLDGGATFSILNWKLIDTLIGENVDDELLPATWASSFIFFVGGIPDTSASLDSSNGLGAYFAGAETGFDSAVIRGGSRGESSIAGLFAMNLFYGINDIPTTTGFRCVYHP